MSNPTGKVPALKLTLGGAPDEWHVIEGVGYVHPSIPSPVDGPGELPLDRARECDRSLGTRVKLVQVTPEQAQQGREAREQARSVGLAGAREAKAAGKKALPADVGKVVSEVAAATGSETAAAGEEK